MTLVFPDVGEDLALTAIVTKENYYLRLFSNDVTPAEGDTVGTYTEVTGGGYAQKTLSTGSWSVASSEASYAQQTWTFSAGGPAAVYGYYLVGASSGTLLLAEQFSDGPYDVSETGAVIKITPQITAS